MFVIRWLLGRIILLLNVIFSPKFKNHPADVRKQIESILAGTSLYQYPACPFCVKVRRAMKSQGIVLPLVNVKSDAMAKQQLIEHGGRLMVPCLRMETEQGVNWMYESSDIIAHLNAIVSRCYDEAAK